MSRQGDPLQRYVATMGGTKGCGYPSTEVVGNDKNIQRTWFAQLVDISYNPDIRQDDGAPGALVNLVDSRYIVEREPGILKYAGWRRGIQFCVGEIREHREVSSSSFT